VKILPNLVQNASCITARHLIYKDECLYVCLYLIRIRISEPIGTKLCTHLPRGLEEAVGYVWAHNISTIPPFRPILSGAVADLCPVDGCRRHTALLQRYIRVCGACLCDVIDGGGLCNENTEK